MAAYRMVASWGLLLGVAVSMLGCGSGGSESQLWDEAVELAERRQEEFVPAVEGGSMERSVMHQTTSQALNMMLGRNRDAPEDGLSSLLEQVSENERQLAYGEVDGAAAEDLRARQDEYWSHLVNRELPPDYR